MLTGDFHRLAMLRQKLAQLANGRARALLLTRMASEVHSQVVDGFRSFPPRRSSDLGRG